MLKSLIYKGLWKLVKSLYHISSLSFCANKSHASFDAWLLFFCLSFCFHGRMLKTLSYKFLLFFVILSQYYSNDTSMLLSAEETMILLIVVPILSIIIVDTLSSIFLRITFLKSRAPRTLPSIFETIADGVLSS